MKLYQMMLMEFFFSLAAVILLIFLMILPSVVVLLKCTCFSVQTKGDKSNSLLLHRNVFIFTQECINLTRNSLHLKCI